MARAVTDYDTCSACGHTINVHIYDGGKCGGYKCRCEEFEKEPPRTKN